MRRTDREVKQFDDIINILDKCKVIHLAMVSDGKPYSVPLNFGYIVGDDNELTLYFHGAAEGRKVDALKANPQVCFSAECQADIGDHGGKNIPCEWTCYYQSVIGFGKTAFVEDETEKKIGLDSLMLHLGYELAEGEPEIKYNEADFKRTALIKIEVEEITGKVRK